MDFGKKVYFFCTLKLSLHANYHYETLGTFVVMFICTSHNGVSYWVYLYYTTPRSESSSIF